MTNPPALPVQRLRFIVLLLAVVALGAALAHWAYRREDRRLRDVLLEQTRRTAETMIRDAGGCKRWAACGSDEPPAAAAAAS